ncbi:hypothetical protein EYZ11_005768 [Aspergillus tanneri]|uniref:SGNH hydrolase-type esterase domain-containing protein n=1 Tax=Aspergillus tanneri TaxID=1220188 RepID=A0A4S3JH31_9EURO|nr:hypothetical protein EYZ11_005768 [Aspergillus tanneri]
MLLLANILHWFFLFLAVYGACIPLRGPLENGNSTINPEHNDLHVFSKRASRVNLRILPLGASITFGQNSATGNGYRKPLRDELRYQGWEVNMVGTKTQGTMVDNNVEAHGGDIIDQVKSAAQDSLPYRPNVVLINAGTNDCARNIDIDNAGGRMRSLIESVVNTEDMEKTLIVLSTLIPSQVSSTEANRPSVNRQYRELVSTMRGEGISIVLADMDPEAPSPGHGWLHYPEDYTTGDNPPDDTHPNDKGYSKMAYIWSQAIDEAADEELIAEPGPMAPVPCEKDYGDGVDAGGLTQRGSGLDDGIYYHDSQEKGTLLSLDSQGDDGDHFFFARLFRRERDDLLRWNKNDDAVVYHTWKNTGNEKGMFKRIGDVSVADNCKPAGVNFIDINADGLDDFVCIAPDGTAFASINKGDGTDSSPPSFHYLGKIKNPEGYPRDNVRLGDVDGDGRADYCVVQNNGDTYCWRNGWIKDVPEYWQPLGKQFTGNNMDIEGLRFEDINGDITTWTNSRSCIKGKDGDGLNIVWRQGYHKGKTTGPTHDGMGSAHSGLRGRIHFARIYGEAQDFGLLGRQDYVFLEKAANRVNLRVWKNIGSGGTKIKGHSNGMMDYVWILSKGKMTLYPNKGLNTVSDNGESFWGPSSTIFDPNAMSIARDVDRRDLHLMDWDGDGACDIVWTDPDNDNRVHLWRNRIKETGSFDWEYQANPAPDLYCPEQRGQGIFDTSVRFADITGNGRDDYLCVERDGRTWGWVHDDNHWEYIDQFKFSEGKDRANLHWADVDGDGRADMIHTDKFTGDGSVWYNRGRRDVGGSRFEWQSVGAKYKGAVAGSCIYFPELSGNGRADMHSITHALDNTARTLFNRCTPPDSTGDDGPITDPNLPEPSG